MNEAGSRSRLNMQQRRRAVILVECRGRSWPQKAALGTMLGGGRERSRDFE